MNKLKKLYRDFFGLTEQTKTKQTSNDIEIAAGAAKDPAVFKAAQDQAKKSGGNIRITANEAEIDEAQLINNITDYRGGVEYVLRDPAEAKSVANEIREWATKKGFTVIKHEISKSGNIGYFYFRLGEDPARESQRIQGYIAQKPEIKHFRFNVKETRQPRKINKQIQPEI
jgi:ABC-type uncharacterized transport system substrate-binding protein